MIAGELPELGNPLRCRGQLDAEFGEPRFRVVIFLFAVTLRGGDSDHGE